MFTIKVILNFCGAHFLRNYKGKCESLHGHNWKVEVAVSSNSLDQAGMVMDFTDLKKMTNTLLDELDHKNLNDLEYFTSHNPSSEEICRYLYQRLSKQVSANKAKIAWVTVWETENSCASYQE